MSNAKYIFRLDDICPTMDWDKFNKLKKIFKKYNIKPILGVVPDNKDPDLVRIPVNHDLQKKFWNEIRQLRYDEWIVAQHGYQHKFITKDRGLLKINNYSEFAGLPINEQQRKIREGKKILEDNLGQKIIWWIAPAHSFDQNTCKVLKKLNFKYISDGIFLYPSYRFQLQWIPQQLWSPVKKKNGIWTICIHPNNINDTFINEISIFLKTNYQNCINPNNIQIKSFNALNFLFPFFWYLKYKISKFLKIFNPKKKS